MTSKEIEKVGLPPFDRLPFRAPEAPDYRTDALPEHLGNPAYLAVPGMVSQLDLVTALTKSNPPLPDDALRSKPPEFRREALNRLQGAFFPVRRVVDLYNMVMPTIRDSYLFRNPAEPGFMERLAASAGTIGSGSPPPSTNLLASAAPVGCGSLIGNAGLGKSIMLKRILQVMCPQVIQHRQFQGQKIGLNQLAWIYIPCPPKCSIGALAWWIALVLDYLFSTDTARRVLAARTDPIRWQIVCRALALHVTGLVVIDEIQNIAVGADATKTSVFETMLQEAINTTHVRFMFCGTPETFSAIRTSAMIRRMVGEDGQLCWGLHRLDAEWVEYLTFLTALSFTQTPVHLDDDWIATMHELTDGTPDFATKLFTKAQKCVIGDSRFKGERIEPELLRQVWAKFFQQPALKVEAEQQKRKVGPKRAPAKQQGDEDDAIQQPTAPSSPDMGNQNPLPAPPTDADERPIPKAAAKPRVPANPIPAPTFSLTALVPGAHA